MERLPRNTAATIKVTVTAAGEPKAADSAPTVTITRDNGEVLVEDAASTAVAGETGVYSYELTPTQTELVDLLTASWSAKVGGVTNTFETTVEIVGEFLCSLTAIKNALPSGTTKEDPEVEEARMLAEDWLEEACGLALRRRYARDDLDGSGGGELRLYRARPLKLRSVKMGSLTGATRTALTEEDVEAIQLYKSGKLFRIAGWWPGKLNVEVIYEHGFAHVEAPVARAAVKLARLFLVEDPSDYDERATSISTDQAHYLLTTPGMRGAITAIPEVNVVIQRYAAMGMG